jgi:hypothetical protein
MFSEERERLYSGSVPIGAISLGKVRVKGSSQTIS